MSRTTLRFVALVVCGLLAMTACTIQPPQPVGTIGETPTPKPKPTLHTVAHPSQFDRAQAVHLEPVDGVTQGMLDGRVFYTVDYTGTIWGIDVSTGDTVLNAWFPGYDTGGTNPWSCYRLATDASRVYTIGADNTEDPAIPVAVRLVAVDKADSTVLWDYTPETTALPVQTECDNGSVQYAITVTDAGLLLTMQQFTDGVWTPTSVMLDPTTGDVVWSVPAAVSAAGGAVGIAITPASGSAQYQASPVNLKTGAMGPPLVGSPGDGPLTATSFTLAGAAGGNLVVVAQLMPDDNPGTSDTFILPVANSTGALANGSTVRAVSTDLNACRLAQPGVLVCTSLSDPTRAVGVSVADGKTLWQQVFTAPSAESGLPLLFDGYLYGADASGATSFVLDAATGKAVAQGQYPPPIAVNGAGIVYSIPDSTTISGSRCLWAPAIA